MKRSEINYESYSIWAQATALYARWANDNKMSYPKMVVLYALMTRKNLSQKKICENYGLTKQTVNGLINTLEKEELLSLTTNPQDKREKIIHLNDEGQAYVSQKVGRLVEIEESIYRKIGYERIKESNDTMNLYNLLLERELENK